MTSEEKIRVYRCSCGGECVRPDRRNPKPCDRCYADLRFVEFVIQDRESYVAELLQKKKGGMQ